MPPLRASPTFARFSFIYDWRHYLALAIVLGPMADNGSLQRKPGALRNGAPFLEMPEPFRKLQAKMLRQPGGDREMVDILSLVLHHDEQAVLRAVELALQAGVPTKTHVLNLATTGCWMARRLNSRM